MKHTVTENDKHHINNLYFAPNFSLSTFLVVIEILFSKNIYTAYPHPFAVHRSRPSILADFALKDFKTISGIS